MKIQKKKMKPILHYGSLIWIEILSETKSEDEDEVYPCSNFILCANNLINHCKDQASHIKILKRDNFILEEELKEIGTSQNECSSLGKHDQAFHKFITSGIDRIQLASIIYGVGKYNREGLG